MRPPGQYQLLEFSLQRPLFLLLALVLTLHVLSLPSWSHLLHRPFCFQQCCLGSLPLSRGAALTGVTARWNIQTPRRLLQAFTGSDLSCPKVHEQQCSGKSLFLWLVSNSGPSFFSVGVSSRRNANDLPEDFSSVTAPTAGQGRERGPRSSGGRGSPAARKPEAGTTRGHPSPISGRGAPGAASLGSAAVHRGPSKRPETPKPILPNQEKETLVAAAMPPPPAPRPQGPPGRSKRIPGAPPQLPPQKTPQNSPPFQHVAGTGRQPRAATQQLLQQQPVRGPPQQQQKQPQQQQQQRTVQPLYQQRLPQQRLNQVHRQQTQQQLVERQPVQQQRAQQQQVQQQQVHQQQEASRKEPSVLQESLDLVAWLRDSRLAIEGVVVAKGETGARVHLRLPVAAQQLLPAQVHVPRPFFSASPKASSEGPESLDDTSSLRSGARGVSGPSEGSACTAPQGEDSWRDVQLGDIIRVVVLGAKQNPQQQQQQQQQAASNTYSRQERSAIRPLPARPSAMLELIVQPIQEESASSVTPLSESAAKAAASLKALAQQGGATERELLERLSQQDVSRWLRFLSPPSATWVVPAAPKGAAQQDVSFRAPRPLLRFRAPPSSRPLRCRVVGLLQQQQAAVVEVLAPDDDWHPAVRILAGEGPGSASPTDSLSAAAAAEGLKHQAPGGVAAGKGLNGHGDAADHVVSKNSLDGGSAGHARVGGRALLYKEAERALRLQQQTCKDPLLQEELLAQQEALLRKVLPRHHAARLKALRELCQHHPQLNAYLHHLHSHPEALQEDALGALALLPLTELSSFMRIRKEWRPEHPLRLYFSYAESWEGSGRKTAAPKGFSRGRFESAAPEIALLWFSIYPAVPLEVAHLLLQGMPVPHYLAPHFRMFEQRELAQQQEDHQQLLKHIQRHHEALAHERALRRQRRLEESEAGEAAAATTGASATDGGSAAREKSRARHQPAKGQEGEERAKGQKHRSPPLHRIPVKPLWWASGDWLHREARLCQTLGPFFYRQLLRARAQALRAESEAEDSHREPSMDRGNETEEDAEAFNLFKPIEQRDPGSPLMQLLRLHSRVRLQLRPQRRAPSLEEWKRLRQQREVQRKGHRRPQSLSSSPIDEELMKVSEDLPQAQPETEEQSEYDGVDKLADDVERQLVDSYKETLKGPDYATEAQLPFARAYPSPAVRKPRSFYNYMGEDALPVTDDEDENSPHLTWATEASNAHDFFIPLSMKRHHSFAASPSLPDAK